MCRKCAKFTFIINHFKIITNFMEKLRTVTAGQNTPPGKEPSKEQQEGAGNPTGNPKDNTSPRPDGGNTSPTNPKDS